jgi:peptidoglycan/LPS O-acetylase OafA/YrhL
MTYSVYLFHYWLYDTAKKVWAHFDINFVNVEVQALLTLFLFCFLMMHLIEKQGIKVGRWVIGKY